MGERSDCIGYVEVAGFAGVENGKAQVNPLEVSVNSPVKGLGTKFSERVHGERISIYKERLPAQRTSQMSAVEKKWHEVQRPLGEKSDSEPMGNSPKYYQSPKESNGDDSWILKNVKELAEKAHGLSNFALGLSAGAIIIAVIAIMISLATKAAV
jgi:hypothetical protein